MTDDQAGLTPDEIRRLQQAGVSPDEIRQLEEPSPDEIPWPEHPGPDQQEVKEARQLGKEFDVGQKGVSAEALAAEVSDPIPFGFGEQAREAVEKLEKDEGDPSPA